MSQTTSLPVVRFSLAGFLSVIITFLLFFLMQELIRSTTNIIPADSGPTFGLNIVKVKKDTPVIHKKHITPPPEVDHPPPLPHLQPLVNPTVNPTLVFIDDGGKTAGPDPIRGGVPVEEGDYLPVFKVTPVYPISASSQGIEGYTIVEYTVATNGSTKDISVIKAEPSSIFNRVSIEATAKFKYKPRVIDGTPVEVRGVQNKFTFQLE